MAKKQKICLAFSGGLDTSVIASWLIEQGFEVICFVADVGQDDDFGEIQDKAAKMGALRCYVEDVRDEFVRELCFPAIQCNASYENVYLLGTSLARPVIARAQIAVAEREGCQFVGHGATAYVLIFLFRPTPKAETQFVIFSEWLTLTVRALQKRK